MDFVSRMMLHGTWIGPFLVSVTGASYSEVRAVELCELTFFGYRFEFALRCILLFIATWVMVWMTCIPAGI